METKDEKGLMKQNIEAQKEKVLEKIYEEQGVEQGPAQLENIEEETSEGGVISYKRIDTISGELTNIDEIEAYKVSQIYDVVLNHMLGDYDNEGEYVISTEILNALVKVNKRVVRAYADTLYLESFTEFGEKGRLQFSLSFIRADGNKQKAILKLLEPISKVNDYIINTHSFIVATYTDENDDNYLRKVRKVFHIYNSEDEVGKEDPEIVACILNRLKMLEIFKEELLLNLQEREEKYFLARIDILKAPELEEILLEFERLKAKTGLFLNPDDPLYFFHLNMLLDMAIENKLHILRKEENKKYLVAVKGAVREYVQETNIAIQEARQKTELALGQSVQIGKNAEKSKKKGGYTPPQYNNVKPRKLSKESYNTKSQFGAGKKADNTKSESKAGSNIQNNEKKQETKQKGFDSRGHEFGMSN